MKFDIDEDIEIAVPAPGTVINDRYRLVHLLGEGSFAWVYAAQHQTIESLRFAIKILKPAYARNPDILRRFKHEAVTIGNLQGRHTARVFDFGVSADRLPFIVMELVVGVSLRALLVRYGQLKPLPTAVIALGIAKALEEAHRTGVVHRDLKPANVLITHPGGEPHPIAKVLDFGIAKVLAGEEKPAHGGEETMEGLLFCSPRYAAPELLLGRAELVTDIYALGHIMAEMLDGHSPYHGEPNILLAARHLNEDPVPLGSDASTSPLVDIIRKACAKRLDERYADASQLVNDLRAKVEDLMAEAGSSEFALDLSPMRRPLTEEDATPTGAELMGSGAYAAAYEATGPSPTGAMRLDLPSAAGTSNAPKSEKEDRTENEGKAAKVGKGALAQAPSRSQDATATPAAATPAPGPAAAGDDEATFISDDEMDDSGGVRASWAAGAPNEEAVPALALPLPTQAAGLAGGEGAVSGTPSRRKFWLLAAGVFAVLALVAGGLFLSDREASHYGYAPEAERAADPGGDVPATQPSAQGPSGGDAQQADPPAETPSGALAERGAAVAQAREHVLAAATPAEADVLSLVLADDEIAAAAYIGDDLLGALPLSNLFGGPDRPLALRVEAEGHEAAIIEFGSGQPLTHIVSLEPLAPEPEAERRRDSPRSTAPQPPAAPRTPAAPRPSEAAQSERAPSPTQERSVTPPSTNEDAPTLRHSGIRDPWGER